MKNNKMSWATIILVIVGVVLLIGIVVWGSSQKKETTKKETPKTTEEPTNTDTPTPTADTSEAGKLGANEQSITAANFDSVVVGADKVFFVDVYSPTCPHCTKVGPIITALSDQFAGKAYFGKMSAGESSNLDFINSKDISGVPTVLIYKNGKEVGRLEGSKTKEEYITEINKYL